MSRTPSLDAWLIEARRRLADVSDSSELEARWLAEHVLGLDTVGLILAGPRALDPESIARLEAARDRRTAGEPLAHIIGRAGFAGLDLAVGPDVLIPRADTETLVEAVLACLPSPSPARVADLGTGSGAIALALARARPHWRITATDISAPALACARANAHAHEIDSVCFIESDWYTALGGRVFDLIAANPPYIAEDDPHLATLIHEPRGALVACDNGLADLARLAEQSPAHLAPGGWLILEHGWQQADAVRALLRAQGFEAVETRRDLADRDRITLGRRPSSSLADAACRKN